MLNINELINRAQEEAEERTGAQMTEEMIKVSDKFATFCEELEKVSPQMVNKIDELVGEIASAYSNGYFKLGFESGAIADLKIRNLVKKDLSKRELAV